ncbi:MAG: hypothetical protein ACJAVR_000448 [Paracoccaceae bacterium]|jgi:hypothetical protein
MLVRADNGAIDHLDCTIARAAGHQSLENTFDYPGVAPTSKPAPDGVRLAKALG